MSYGPNWPSLWRRAAEVVDKILRGAKPADSPVEQPRTCELVINLKTAKTLKRTTPCTRTTPWKASDRHLRLLRPGAVGWTRVPPHVALEVARSLHPAAGLRASHSW